MTAEKAGLRPMKSLVAISTTEHFTDECLNLMLDEAERAILQVEARADEPSRRVLHGDVPEGEHVGRDVSELRLAIAELVDAYPSLMYDLELICERLRNSGATGGAFELESRPHVLDLVRMSLEIFFRQHQDSEAYEADQRRNAAENAFESGHTAIERYEAYTQLLALLRSRLS